VQCARVPPPRACQPLRRCLGSSVSSVDKRLGMRETDRTEVPSGRESRGRWRSGLGSCLRDGEVSQRKRILQKFSIWLCADVCAMEKARSEYGPCRRFPSAVKSQEHRDGTKSASVCGMKKTCSRYGPADGFHRGAPEDFFHRTVEEATLWYRVTSGPWRQRCL